MRNLQIVFVIFIILELLESKPASAFSLPYVDKPIQKVINQVKLWTRNNPLCIYGVICSPVKEPYPAPVEGGKFGAARSYGPHRGVDYPGEHTGRAIFNGEVVNVFRGGRCGGGIEIQGAGGLLRQVVCHVRSFVNIGQRVLAGDPIGRVDGSGNGTGYHLHAELHIAGKPVDPEQALKDPKTVSMIVNATSSPNSSQISQVSPREKTHSSTTETQLWLKILQELRKQQENKALQKFPESSFMSANALSKELELVSKEFSLQLSKENQKNNSYRQINEQFDEWNNRLKWLTTSAAVAGLTLSR